MKKVLSRTTGCTKTQAKVTDFKGLRGNGCHSRLGYSPLLARKGIHTTQSRSTTSRKSFFPQRYRPQTQNTQYKGPIARRTEKRILRHIGQFHYRSAHYSKMITVPHPFHATSIDKSSRTFRATPSIATRIWTPFNLSAVGCTQLRMNSTLPTDRESIGKSATDVANKILNELNKNVQHLSNCKPPVGATSDHQLVDFEFGEFTKKIIDSSLSMKQLTVPQPTSTTVPTELEQKFTLPINLDVFDEHVNPTYGARSVKHQLRLAEKYAMLLKYTREMDQLDENYMTRQDQRSFLKKISNRVGLEMPDFSDEKERNLEQSGAIKKSLKYQLKINPQTGKVERVPLDQE